MRNLRLLLFSTCFGLFFTTIFYLTLGDASVKFVKEYIVGEKLRKSHVDHALMDGLGRKVRVFCFIPTSTRNLATKATAARDTWMKRCNKYAFFTSEDDPTFPTIRLPNIREGMNGLTEKTLAAFEYIYDHYFNDADWFLKADDDSYFVIENLRYLLSHYDPRKAIFFGHRLHLESGQTDALGAATNDTERPVYMSGGGGYVLSKKALRQLVLDGLSERSLCRRKGGAEDAAIGRCLHSLGIQSGSSLDVHGRQTFHPFTLSTHLTGSFPQWYYQYSEDPVKTGKDCCSEYTISYHFVDHENMYLIDHLLYDTSVHGRKESAMHKDQFKIR